jgi:SAM-dependent methyltransferase
VPSTEPTENTFESSRAMARQWGHVVEIGKVANPLGRPSPHNYLLRWVVRKVIHFFSYRFFLKRRTTTLSQAAGFRLVVPPTVFHPGIFITSGFFASFLNGLDLRAKWVAEVGTGSGILALAAARAGAAKVIAIDINPNAVHAAWGNAKANGVGGQVRSVCSNLLSAIAPRPLFDVILSSPPSFAGEPLDLAEPGVARRSGLLRYCIAVRSVAQAARIRWMSLRSPLVRLRSRSPGPPDRAGGL